MPATERIEQAGLAIAQVMEDKFRQILDEAGVKSFVQEFGTQDEDKSGDNFNAYVQDTSFAIMNGGRTRDGGQLESVNDLFTMEEAKVLIPRAITNIITLPAEPSMVITPLFKKITIGPAQEISFPSIGALPDAQDMGETEQYPVIGRFDMDGTITAKAGKVGLKAMFTEKFFEINNGPAQFNILSIILTEINRAFARTKERKAVGALLEQGTTAFDNIRVNGRRTTGRDSAGALNGTLTPEDILRVYTEMINDGFMPNMLICHPLAWPMFMQDDMRRYSSMSHGTPPMSQLFQTHKGEPGFPKFNQNSINPLQRMHAPIPELATTFTEAFQGIMPFGLRPVVTPHMPFWSPTATRPSVTDMFIVDSNYIGYLFEEDALKRTEWVDPEKDIRNFGLKERYCFATDLQGRAIRKIRGVSVDRYAFNFRDRFRYTPTFAQPIALDDDGITGFPA